MIRVLLADDQALVRGALAAMLGLEADIEVVAQVSSGDEVLCAARETKPDVALLDVQMPGRDGITAAAELHRELPDCRIVVCTTFGRPGYLARAMAAGVVGFVVKDAPPEQLVEAVRRVHAGLRVVDPALAAESLATGSSPPTDRGALSGACATILYTSSQSAPVQLLTGSAVTVVDGELLTTF